MGCFEGPSDHSYKNGLYNVYKIYVRTIAKKYAGVVSSGSLATMYIYIYINISFLKITSAARKRPSVQLLVPGWSQDLFVHKDPGRVERC